MNRFGESVGWVQIQPPAPWAPEQYTPLIIRGDLFDMAVVHVLIVAAIVATSIFHIMKVTLGHSDISRTACTARPCHRSPTVTARLDAPSAKAGSRSATEQCPHEFGRQPVTTAFSGLERSHALRVRAERVRTSRGEKSGDVDVQRAVGLRGRVDLDVNRVVQRRPAVPGFTNVCT